MCQPESTGLNLGSSEIGSPARSPVALLEAVHFRIATVYPRWHLRLMIWRVAWGSHQLNRRGGNEDDRGEAASGAQRR